MIGFRKHHRVVNLIAVLGMSGAITLLFAQVAASKSDADQIASVMAALSAHSKAPSDLLDPTLSTSDRAKNLKRFGTSRYEVSLVPTQGVQEITGDLASVPIRVHFVAEDGNQLDSDATAHFVRRNGTWYFASFEFLGWPFFLVCILIVGVLVGIGYATTVLILGNRLLKKGGLGINAVKMFLPFFWPELFRQIR